MTAPGFIHLICITLIFGVGASLSHAEWEDGEKADEMESSEEMYREEMNSDGNTKRFKKSKSWQRKKKTNNVQQTEKREDKKRTKYFVEDTNRVDAGIFHVGFAAGGNFYIEPRFDQNNAPTGSYFKDFGFQAGAYFDYDYDDMALGLRGFVGYKYILNSVHVFAFEGTARLRLAFSNDAAFGIGLGSAASLWYRQDTTETQGEEIAFVPFFIITAGFDFNPFMIDFKFPIHRIGQNTTILGLELYFGVRL